MTGVEARLDGLLDAVQVALARSDYAALPGLTQDIAAQLTKLVGNSSAVALSGLRRKAARNAVCLQAAQRGLRAARRRLDDIRASGAGLVTYDDKGKRATLVEPGKLTQRI